jgi:hypothetical protein
MRELKIFAVVAFFTLFTYYLVEPYAHHAMHAKYDAQGNEIHIDSHGFVYDGTTEAAASAVAVSDLTYKIGQEICKVNSLIKKVLCALFAETCKFLGYRFSSCF